MRVAAHGYLEAAVGVGEAARRGIRALAAQGVEIAAHTITLDGRDDVSPPWSWSETSWPARLPIDAELLYVNPEALPTLLSGLAPRRPGVKRIGVWSWESDVVPRDWVAAAAELDEVWTYSRSSAAILGAALSTPVVTMPIPVTSAPCLPAPELPGNEGPRLLCVFDHLSTLERKNPLGVIAAFSRAFRNGEGPQLVVKTIGARHRPEAHGRLLEAAGKRGDVVVLDRVLDGGALVGLLRSSAALVSLHRSEGFGLLPAEAALLGVPVVATGFGGILDFLDDETAWLVDHSLVEVGAGVDHYPSNGTWAEPDLDHAAAGMRELVDDPARAATRAVRAQRRIERELGPEAVGRRMCDRLASGRRSPGRIAQSSAGVVPRQTAIVVGVLFRGEHQLGSTLRALLERTPPEVPIVVVCGGAERSAAELAVPPGAPARVDVCVAEGTRPPWSELLGLLSQIACGDLALVAPGVGVGEGWLEGLLAAAHDATVATANALVIADPGAGRTGRMLGEAAPAPSASGRVLVGAWRLRPELSFASARCVLLRRAALDLLGDSESSLAEPVQILAEFGHEAVARGLRNVVADEVLVCDSLPRLRGFRPPDDEFGAMEPDAPAVPGPIRATDRGSALKRTIDRAHWLVDGPDVTLDVRGLDAAGAQISAYALGLVRALVEAGMSRLRVVTDRGLAVDGDQLDDADGVELLSTEQVSAERPTMVVHRLTTISTAEDLNLLRLCGRRIVLTQPDLISYRVTSYHASSADWRAHRQIASAALATADLTLVFSDWTRRELLAEGLAPAERVRSVVVGIATPAADDGRLGGADGVAALAPSGLDTLHGPFLLCLGSDQAHMNRPFAVRLFLELWERHGWSGSLVLAGEEVGFGSTRAVEDKLLQAHPALRNAVWRTGEPSAAGRNWLLTRADAVVNASTTEGSGLLPAECAAAGCPCLFADVGALGERAADAATLTPWDAATSADRVYPLLREGPERAAHLGLLGAATGRGSWAEVAGEMLDAYAEATRVPHRSGRFATREVATGDEQIARLRVSDTHHRAVAQEYHDALRALEARVGDGLPLAARDGILSAAERRGLMALAARRPLGSVVLGPIAALGDLARRRGNRRA
jgi:glycosyltransferase involved in cell wall biosynthesis